MGIAVVNLTIKEGDTFIMVLEFWEDRDNTLPVDVLGDSFTGLFEIGPKLIPMEVKFLTPAVNSIELSVDYNLMSDLAYKGTYDIDQYTAQGEKYRILQGTVRVNQEVPA